MPASALIIISSVIVAFIVIVAIIVILTPPDDGNLNRIDVPYGDECKMGDLCTEARNPQVTLSCISDDSSSMSCMASDVEGCLDWTEDGISERSVTCVQCDDGLFLQNGMCIPQLTCPLGQTVGFDLVERQICVDVEELCGPGTVWNDETRQCIGA